MIPVGGRPLHYTPEYFARLQANYQAGKPGVWKRIALLQELVAPTPSDRLLETGFGQGTIALEFAKHCRTVIGVDRAPEAVAAAQAFFAQVGAPANVRLLRADLAALPFPAASFDTVLFSEVVEHCEDPLGVLCELRRVLRPAGRLVLTTWPNRANLTWASRYRKGEGPAEDFNPQTPGSLARLVSLAGLRIQQQRLTNFFVALPNTRYEFDGCGQTNPIARFGERWLTKAPFGPLFAASINLVCEKA